MKKLKKTIASVAAIAASASVIAGAAIVKADNPPPPGGPGEGPGSGPGGGSEGQQGSQQQGGTQGEQQGPPSGPGQGPGPGPSEPYDGIKHYDEGSHTEHRTFNPDDHPGYTWQPVIDLRTGEPTGEYIAIGGGSSDYTGQQQPPQQPTKPPIVEVDSGLVVTPTSLTMRAGETKTITVTKNKVPVGTVVQYTTNVTAGDANHPNGSATTTMDWQKVTKAEAGKLEFKSSNQQVAVVDPGTGEVKAVAPGTAVITVTSTAPGNAQIMVIKQVTGASSGGSREQQTSSQPPKLSAKVKITVEEGEPIETTQDEDPVKKPTEDPEKTTQGEDGTRPSLNVTFDPQEINITGEVESFTASGTSVLKIGESGESRVIAQAKYDTVALTASVTPAEANNDVTWSWSSSDNNIITVNGNGNKGYVTAVKPGMAKVIAKATAQGREEPTKPSEPQAPGGPNDGPGGTPPAPPSGPSQQEMPTPVQVEESAVVTVTNPEVAVTWSSSDPSIVSVDPSTGKTSAKGIGKATITATSVKDNNTASYNVEVKETGSVMSEPKTGKTLRYDNNKFVVMGPDRNIIPDGASVPQGEKVKIVAKTDVRNKLDSIKANGSEISKENGYEYTVPDTDGEIVLSAEYIPNSLADKESKDLCTHDSNKTDVFCDLDQIEMFVDNKDVYNGVEIGKASNGKIYFSIIEDSSHGRIKAVRYNGQKIKPRGYFFINIDEFSFDHIIIEVEYEN